MKKALLVLFFIGSTTLANAACEDTTEYKFYKNILSVNSLNSYIEQNKKFLKNYEGMRPTHEVNENINSIKKEINQLEWARDHSFASYKKMGGKANSKSSLERLKSPCSNDYSDTDFVGQELRQMQNMKVWSPPKEPETENPFEMYTGPHETAHQDFGRGENRNGRYDEGNGRKSNTVRQGDSQSDLQKTIESGLSLYQLFKR